MFVVFDASGTNPSPLLMSLVLGVLEQRGKKISLLWILLKLDKQWALATLVEEKNKLKIRCLEKLHGSEL